MSLNRKRRIFRPSTRPLPSRDRLWAAPEVLLAAAGGAITVVVATWLFVRSSDAPARPPAIGHVAAAIDRVMVLDGDTLRVGDQVVRLRGIVAPTRGSVCHRAIQGSSGQADVDCGSAAADALASLVRGVTVDCAISGHDDRGRPAGNCMAGGTRLNEALVEDGWARAETADLRPQEAAAQAAGRGIWRAGS